MKIAYRRYILKPSDNATDRFDLSKSIVRTKKQNPFTPEIKPETYEDVDDIGYGMSLENCFQQIVSNETSKNLGEETVSIKQYIDQYRKEKEELVAHLLKVSQIKIN